MVIIKELQIRNCLSFSHVLLNFEKNNFASIFNCATAFKLKSKLIKAIQPFFCKDMMELAMDGTPGIDRSSSYIKIKFIIPKAEGKDVVDAMRFSSKPNEVVYSFDDEQYTDPIQVFHERCQIDVSSHYPFLRDVFSNENSNLLFNWVSSNWAQRKDGFEYICDFLELSNSQSHSEQRRIAKLMDMHLFIGRECEFVKKRTFIDVANEIGRIFQYITYEEYNVKFVIPLFGTNLNLSEVKWDDMDLNKIETRVKKTSGSEDCVWNQLEPGLKNLLKISQMIALSKYLNQKFISIEDTSILQEYQNQEMIKEAILQKNSVNIEANWERKNFLKQIIDVCNNMEIMIFLNYHGALPLPPMNANIIKCSVSNDTDRIYVCTDLQSMSLDDFLNLFMPCAYHN